MINKIHKYRSLLRKLGLGESKRRKKKRKGKMRNEQYGNMRENVDRKKKLDRDREN